MEQEMPVSPGTFSLTQTLTLWKQMYSRAFAIFFIEANQCKAKLFTLFFLSITCLLLAFGAWLFLCFNLSLFLYRNGISFENIFLLIAILHLAVSCICFFLIKAKSQRFFPVTEQAIQTLMNNGSRGK